MTDTHKYKKAVGHDVCIQPTHTEFRIPRVCVCVCVTAKFSHKTAEQKKHVL